MAHTARSRVVTGVIPLVFLFSLTTPTEQALAASVCPFAWDRNLRIGMYGNDVKALQQFLNQETKTTIAASGAGSPGNETQTFGPATARAVSAFQELYASDILTPAGLSKGSGFFGTGTRAKANMLCAASQAAVVPSTQPNTSAQTASAASAIAADSLTVSDPGQPATSIAPSDAGALFLSFTLSAGSKDVTVSNVTITRSGLGSDAAFASFGLWDEDGMQVGSVASLGSDHTAVFRRQFTIPAGTSRTFEVWANMHSNLSDYEGQMPAIQLTALQASSPITGTLPLRGTMQSINGTLTIGGADLTVSPYDPGVARDRYINDKNVILSGIRITAHSQENLSFDSIMWTQSGTAGPNDIEHVRTVVNGVEYPTVPNAYFDRKYVTFFDPGIIIQKGNTVDVYVLADLKTTGANRTVQFDINDINADLGLSGTLYGFGVGGWPSGNTAEAGSHSSFITSDGTTDGNAGTPFYAGSVTTIRGASVTSVGKI